MLLKLFPLSKYFLCHMSDTGFGSVSGCHAPSPPVRPRFPLSVARVFCQKVFYSFPSPCFAPSWCCMFSFFAGKSFTQNFHMEFLMPKELKFILSVQNRNSVAGAQEGANPFSPSNSLLHSLRLVTPSWADHIDKAN